MQDESHRPRPEQIPRHVVPPLGGVDPFSVTPVNAAPSNRGVLYILGAIVLALTLTALVNLGGADGETGHAGTPPALGQAEPPLVIDPPATPPPAPPPAPEQNAPEQTTPDQNIGQNSGSGQ